MAGSDVKAVHVTADTQGLDADGISTAASVGNNAALTIGGALADSGSCTFSAGRIVTILSAGDDSGISFTVTGTDVNGDYVYLAETQWSLDREIKENPTLNFRYTSEE